MALGRYAVVALILGAALGGHAFAGRLGDVGLLNCLRYCRPHDESCHSYCDRWGSWFGVPVSDSVMKCLDQCTPKTQFSEPWNACERHCLGWETTAAGSKKTPVRKKAAKGAGSKPESQSSE
jgi:hypothetical protein